MCTTPHYSEAHNVKVLLYELEFVERDERSYFNTKQNYPRYNSAIVTNVDFFGGCARWNHSWNAEAIEYEGQWHILFGSGGNCKRVRLTLVLFEEADGMALGSCEP